MSGSIKRGVHKSKYCVIPNDMIQRDDMSMKAKGMLCYLLSLPGDWIVYKKALQNNFSDGRDACSSAFDELIRLNYIKKDIVRGEDGSFQSVSYEVYDSPISENPITENPISDNTELQSTLITKDHNNKEKNIKKDFVSNEMVDEIYQMYPPKCPTRGASTNKSTKHKDKIKNMLYGKTEEQVQENFEKLKKTISKYIKDCTNNNTWMKAFTTFLNNLPDYGDELDKEVVKNDNGDAIPSELPLVNNRSELPKEFRGVVQLNGENWWFDMVSNSWVKYDK